MTLSLKYAQNPAALDPHFPPPFKALFLRDGLMLEPIILFFLFKVY